MALSSVALYEALKKDLSKENARLLAEAVSRHEDVATRADLADLEVRLRTEIHDGFAALRKEFTRWILAFFLPLWATAAAAIITNLVGR